MNKFAIALVVCFAASVPTGVGAEEPRVYGESMPVGAAYGVAAAIDAGVEPSAAPRKFAGRITEVCQAKGCWLMLEEEGRSARVMMKDHAFSVPKDARGTAIVYGILSDKRVDESTAQHLAEDAGRGAAPVLREYRIEALSVELTGR
jgi:hypothetical protein